VFGRAGPPLRVIFLLLRLPFESRDLALSRLSARTLLLGARALPLPPPRLLDASSLYPGQRRLELSLRCRCALVQCVAFRMLGSGFSEGLSCSYRIHVPPSSDYDTC
jgi:hypothetical protein